MKLQKVDELPARRRTSKYDDIAETVMQSPGVWFQFSPDVKNPSQVGVALKERFGLEYQMINEDLYIRSAPPKGKKTS